MDTERLHLDIKSHLQPHFRRTPRPSVTVRSQVDPPSRQFTMTFWTHMSQKLVIYNHVFFSTHMTIPLQDTLAKQRPFMPCVCNTTGWDFKPTSRITANRAPPVPMQNLCTIDLMDFLNSFQYPRSLGILSHWIS